MVLELKEIKKSYGRVKALEIQNMCFQEGVYGILGPRGAGKTTLVKILTDSIRSDTGSVLYNGTDISEMGQDYRRLLGYMPQEQIGYPGMRVINFMEYMALLKGEKQDSSLPDKAADVLQRVGMEEHMQKCFRELSDGMKRRVLFAQALLGEPKILVLDEPTAGLEPKDRIVMQNLIAQETGNRIVILATHIASDIEGTASQILLLEKGKMKGCMSLEEWLCHKQ